MPSRRELLLGAASTAGLASFARLVAAAEPGKNLVLVVADGGWDPTFVFDPKPGLDGVDGPYPDSGAGFDPDPLDFEEVGTWGEIDVTLNEARRPDVTRFFERFGHRVTALRGVWTGSVSHPVCRRRVLTGSDGHGRPDIPTIVGSELGYDRAAGVVDMSGTGWFGDLSHIAVRTGRNAQLGGLVYPPARLPLPDGTERPLWTPTDPEQDLVEQWLADRGAADAVARPWRQDHLDARADALRRARALRDLGPDLEPLLEASEQLDVQVPLTIELLRSGACSAVIMDTAQAWDTHFNQEGQHGAFNRTFGGLGLLADALEQAELWDDTVVMVVSEMARTPRRNAAGGTDHWPYTAALMFGGGIAGGRVVGGTDDGCVGLGCDPETGRVQPGGPLLTYDSLAAGVLEYLGVDYEAWLPGAQPLRGFRA